MKKFQVTITVKNIHHFEIEAESIEKVSELAKNKSLFYFEKIIDKQKTDIETDILIEEKKQQI